MYFLFSILHDMSRKSNCLIRVESLRYAFLVKKLYMQKISEDILINFMNLDEADYFISQKIKIITPLFIMLDGNPADLVNYRTVLKDKELFRIIENFNLWERRYLQSQVCTH